MSETRTIEQEGAVDGCSWAPATTLADTIAAPATGQASRQDGHPKAAPAVDDGGGIEDTRSAWAKMTKAERIEAVRTGRDLGLSASGIAARHGTTRDAIIGFWTRNRDACGMSPKPAPRPKPAPTTAPRQATKRNPKFNFGGMGMPIHHRVPDVLPAPVPLPSVPDVSVVGRPTLLTARGNQCRYPLFDDPRKTRTAEMFVCGEPVVFGRSWCPACMDRVFSKAPKLVVKTKGGDAVIVEKRRTA